MSLHRRPACTSLSSLYSAFVALALLCFVTGAGAGVAVDVRIEGVSGRMLDNVRAFLGVEQQKKDPDLDAARLQRLHSKAAGEIEKALQPFGYYRPHIETSLSRRGDTWITRYTIDPGPPVRVTTLDIQLEGDGANDTEFQKWRREFPLREGDVLDHAGYETGKETLERLAAERGYFDFALEEHTVHADPEAGTAQVHLHARTGPRYRFGAVNFHQDALRPELLQRFVPFKKGAPFTTSALLELQSALFDSEYFSNVELAPRRDLAEPGDRGEEVPVDAILVPRERHRYTAGLGYGTDTGARARLGWEIRRLNDRGHRLKNELRVSEIQESYTARYVIPFRNPRTDQVAFTASWVDDHPPTSDSQTLLLGASRSVERGKGLLETLYLNFQREDFEVGAEKGRSRLVLPGINWSYVRADNRIYTRHGLRLFLDVRGTDTALGSDNQFVQARGQVKFVERLGERGRLLLRGEAGATRFGSIEELPASLRFFAGGDYSVRGYAYNDLAPRDASGKPAGGEQLLAGSAEYEHRLAEKWSAAVFYDAGNAMNDWRDALKAGAGVGLRWLSPVGQIRLDVAWAVSEPGSPTRLHLTIGPDL